MEGAYRKHLVHVPTREHELAACTESIADWHLAIFLKGLQIYYCIASAGNVVQKHTAILLLLILGFPNNLPSWKEVSISMRHRTRSDRSFSITFYALEEFIRASHSSSVLPSLAKANTALACCLGHVFWISDHSHWCSWTPGVMFFNWSLSTWIKVLNWTKNKLRMVSHVIQTILLPVSCCVLEVSFEAEQHYLIIFRLRTITVFFPHPLKICYMVKCYWAPTRFIIPA